MGKSKTKPKGSKQKRINRIKKPIKKQNKAAKRQEKEAKEKIIIPSKKELQEEFGLCGICGKELKEVDYDTPLYCEECMEQMESMDIDPESYKEYFAPAKKERK